MLVPFDVSFNPVSKFIRKNDINFRFYFYGIPNVVKGLFLIQCAITKMTRIGICEKHFWLFAYSVVVVFAIYALASDQSACEKKILKDFPEAQCSTEKDK